MQCYKTEAKGKKKKNYDDRMAVINLMNKLNNSSITPTRLTTAMKPKVMTYKEAGIP